jgi:hypothetical protein
MLWHIFQFKLVVVVLLKIFNPFEGDLHVLSTGRATLCSQISYGFSFVDLGDASDGERPEYFFADHYQNFALIHSAAGRNKREGNL